MSNAAQSTSNSIRPTKKQRELLSFIESFIGEHGYSPSYREIMNGLSYTSVATVSLHVTSLIRRGHLRKRDRSARSLEVVRTTDDSAVVNDTEHDGERWLVDRVEARFKTVEHAKAASNKTVRQLAALVEALGVLGLPQAAQFAVRLEAINRTVK